MTKNEVIETLQDIKRTYEESRNLSFVEDLWYHFEKMVQALELAIRAVNDLEACREKLCLYCNGKKAPGVCDGCRWRVSDE